MDMSEDVDFPKNINCCATTAISGKGYMEVVRIVGLILILLGLGVSAKATDIQLSSFTLANSRGYSGTIRLRVYYTNCAGTNFITNDGQIIQCGQVGSTTGFFLEIPVTVNGSGTLSIPSFVLPSTDDSSQLTPRATAVFFVNNAKRDTLFSNWVITATLGTPVSFVQLFNYQPNALPSPPPATYLTAAEIAALIQAAVGSMNDASDVIKGRTKLSVAPLVSTNPIAVGNNDPRVALLPPLLATGSGTLTAATTTTISNAAITSSTTLLLIPTASTMIGSLHTISCTTGSCGVYSDQGGDAGTFRWFVY